MRSREESWHNVDILNRRVTCLSRNVSSYCRQSLLLSDTLPIMLDCVERIYEDIVPMYDWYVLSDHLFADGLPLKNIV